MEKIKPFLIKASVVTIIALYLGLTGYLAVCEVDDRLQIHYTAKQRVASMSISDVEQALATTPAGKVLNIP